MADLNRTHDATRRSFIEAANHPAADFPLQNLPLGIFRPSGGEPPRGGVAIGDTILDLAAAREAGLFSGAAEDAAAAASGPDLNPLMALGSAAASALRERVFDLLDAAGPERDRMGSLGSGMLVPMREATIEMPVRVSNFTDFLTSSFHSTRLSPTGKLAPNFMSMPIAYHSRASSVRISGGAVIRPNGQYQRDGAVVFGPTERLDYELELGTFIGGSNALGQPMSLDQARERLFGFCLLNDWSVRDVQIWEMPPLGPFLAKSLSTSISPWVVTEEALRPFRAPAFTRGDGEPAPLPYLSSSWDRQHGGYDIRLQAFLATPRMRAAGQDPAVTTDTNFRHMYWTFGQMATHHMSNGCNLLPGDLIGSGTTSGPTHESCACLAEANQRGSVPIGLPGGETRLWLEDGDEVVFRARAERDGFASIGFGECRAIVAPAPAWPGGGA